jgi:hypothetical protein
LAVRAYRQPQALCRRDPGFFGPAAPIGEIAATHVEEYRQRAATQKLRVWIGGPDPKKRLDRDDDRWWRTAKRIRSARTTNNYLMCLAALFMVAYNTRNPITRERELLFPLEVRLLKTPKREPRPMPDGEFDARQAVSNQPRPGWTAVRPRKGRRVQAWRPTRHCVRDLKIGGRRASDARYDRRRLEATGRSPPCRSNRESPRPSGRTEATGLRDRCFATTRFRCTKTRHTGDVCGCPGAVEIEPSVVLPVGGEYDLALPVVRKVRAVVGDQLHSDRPAAVVGRHRNRGDRFKCPGCHRPVTWRIHGPTWRPTYFHDI